ncbi:MAG: kynureninase [Saprospiraceae bacterium]
MSFSDHAKTLDSQNQLSIYRSLFHIPQINYKDSIYLCGNSLGLMPKQTQEYVIQELDDWKNLGVEGHLHAKNPWLPYHEFLTEQMANIVGAKQSEVVVMNSLTVNLHLMMVSFYRPTSKRYKILVDYNLFPSDRYAIISQLKIHGYSEDSMIELSPDPGTDYVSKETIKNVFNTSGEEIALVLLGGVNYYTGQFYDIPFITELGHAHGCLVGLDLAHAAGNVPLQLHEDKVDFAVWCTYKYLNSGPGSLSGCFIHERFHQDATIPRFAGWWGHDKSVRFLMGPEFEPIPSAEGWQLSNPPILSMAAIRSSLNIFSRATMSKLREKSLNLTQYCLELINPTSDAYRIITPMNPDERGCQISLQMKAKDKSIFNSLIDVGIIADWREPDVIRIAPAPLYNTFEDVYNFAAVFNKAVS